jgi:hypothetical protein
MHHKALLMSNGSAQPQTKLFTELSATIRNFQELKEMWETQAL